MKLTILLIFPFILTLELSAQTKMDYYDSILNVIDTIEFVYKKKYVRKEYGNGQLKEQSIQLTLYKNEILVDYNPGVLEWFNRKGELRRYRLTDMKGRILKRKLYHNNGQLSYEFNYDYDLENNLPDISGPDSIVPHQSWYRKDYRKSGQLKFEGYFYHDVENGKLLQKKRHGTHFWYNRKGEIKRELIYNKGIKN